MLMGERKETRSGEKFGITVMKALSPFFGGGLRRYRPVAAKDVARAMINAAKENRPGFFVYEYDEIKAHS
jgi:uncharacterized protein YbjT (DUF2867 family)